MQIRVVNAQPWDVRTDVLAIPVSGDGEPDDAMVEIYRDGVESMPPALDELTIVLSDGDETAVRAAAERGVIIGEGTNRARRLAQRSSNDITPEALADEAVTIAREHGLKTKIFGPDK